MGGPRAVTWGGWPGAGRRYKDGTPLAAAAGQEINILQWAVGRRPLAAVRAPDGNGHRSPDDRMIVPWSPAQAHIWSCLIQTGCPQPGPRGW